MEIMCTTTKSTVTVQCPACRHVGPAYRHLLGQHCRCKMCGHAFQMPRYVHLVCPGCASRVRVLPEMLDRLVSCKFCDAAFRASFPPAGSANAPCPGEHAALRPAPPRTREAENPGTVHRDAEPDRAEALRMGLARLDRAEQLLILEQALSEILNQQKALQADVHRMRSESRAHADHERLDIESLRTELRRLEMQRLERNTAHVASRMAGGGSPPEASHVHAAHAVSPRAFSTRPPSRTPAPKGPKASTHAGQADLREIMEHVSHCEVKAEQLVTQLKTTQRGREVERQTFDRVLSRLQDALTHVRCEVEVARGSINGLGASD